MHENFEHEIEQYKLHGGGKKKIAATEELDELSFQKLKQELVKARHDLDQSNKQITGLQHELQAQQNYYEVELKKAQ